MRFVTEFGLSVTVTKKTKKTTKPAEDTENITRTTEWGFYLRIKVANGNKTLGKI